VGHLILSENTRAYLYLDIHSTHGFYIQNQTKLCTCDSEICGCNLEVFVSKFNDTGLDSWYDVPPNFDDPKTCRWHRHKGDWECVVFRNKNTDERRGWYLLNRAGVTKITFYGLNHELGVEYASSV